MDNLNSSQKFLFYTNNVGKQNIQVYLQDETVWITQKGMAEVFACSIDNISLHLKNIFKEGELSKETVVEEFSITASDGKKYKTNVYNLDAIISVGYRVNSQKATQFRIWATSILKEYLIKGFAMDDERLKQGKTLFDKDYFEELLERIKEIRTSERRFYQKITDIYAQCSVDYNPKSSITQQFFATVQNKLEYAITHLTAPEIIKTRANSTEKNMGLTTFKNQKTGGKILKTDVSVAKNYLSHDEISELNSIVSMYLDYAELQAKRNKLITMREWTDRLDTFLQFHEYDILNGAGKLRADIAKKFAESEYDKFRVIQDIEYKSDFDNIIEKVNKVNSLNTSNVSIKDIINEELNKNKKQ